MLDMCVYSAVMAAHIDLLFAIVNTVWSVLDCCVDCE